jgi:proline dehydrogenase
MERIVESDFAILNEPEAQQEQTQQAQQTPEDVQPTTKPLTDFTFTESVEVNGRSANIEVSAESYLATLHSRIQALYKLAECIGKAA